MNAPLQTGIAGIGRMGQSAMRSAMSAMSECHESAMRVRPA